MSNYYLNILKEKTNFLFDPLIRVLAKTKIHPHFFTLLSFLSGLVAVFNIENRSTFILFGILTIFFDIVDGHLARYTKRVTTLGKYLDVHSDRIIELLLIVFAPVNHSLIIVAVVLFLAHHFLYYWVETAFFFRTFLVFGFALGVYKAALVIAIIVYVASSVWQVKELLKSL